MRRQNTRRIGSVQQGLQMTGHDLQRVDAMCLHVLCKGVGIEAQLRRHQVQRPARAQCAEQGRVTQIGRHGRYHGQAVRGFGQVHPLQCRLHVVRQSAMTDDYALGFARRAGGVDDVSGLGGM